MDGEEFALMIGTVSMLSLKPYRWQLGLWQKELLQMTNFQPHHRLVYRDVPSECQSWGELAGISEPSEMGTSAGSLTRVRRRGGSGSRERPLSFRSISARLVLALILLFTLGL